MTADALNFGYDKFERPHSWLAGRERYGWAPTDDDEDEVELVDVAVSLRRPIVAALASTRSDFRTIKSLANELGLAAGDVEIVVNGLVEDWVLRRPLGIVRSEDRYGDRFRLAARGLTWRERWWRVRAFLGRTPVPN